MFQTQEITKNSDSLIELLTAQCADLEKLLTLAREETLAAEGDGNPGANWLDARWPGKIPHRLLTWTGFDATAFHDCHITGPTEPARYSSSFTRSAFHAASTGATMRQHSSTSSPRTDSVGSPERMPASTSP